MRYGERLRFARKNKRLSQAALAKITHVPQATISKIERGDQESSRYDSILAHILECDSYWLTTGNGDHGLDQPERSLEVQQFLKDFESASPEAQSSIAKIANVLLGKETD